jgi:hypothetical protein
VPNEQERGFQCPRCQEFTGRQDGFAVHERVRERQTTRVIVRCTECRHRWSVIVRSPDPGLEPNPAA